MTKGKWKFSGKILEELKHTYEDFFGPVDVTFRI